MVTYEVHITSPLITLDDTWKKLVIELDSGDTPIQPMYSKYFKVEEYEELWKSVKNIPCERLKIEQYNNLPLVKEGDCYYEFHIKIKGDYSKLGDHPYGAHVSRNPQKGGRFLTLRGHGTLASISCRFANLLKRIRQLNIPFSNIQKEYVVYDSNINLDNNWI